MKFFVLTLALAILTGTWASVLSDEPNSKLEKLIEQWKDDWENITRTVQGKLDLIESSEVAKELNDLFTSVSQNIETRFSALNETLPAEVTQALEILSDVPFDVAMKAFDALLALQEYGDLEELGKALQSAAVVYVDPVLERVGPYAATVRRAVVTRTQEISLKMDEKILQQMETLKTQLEPHIKEFQESQESLRPYLDHAQELFRKGAETINKHLLKPYITPILEVYQKYKDDLMRWPVLSPKP